MKTDILMQDWYGDQIADDDLVFEVTAKRWVPKGFALRFTAYLTDKTIKEFYFDPTITVFDVDLYGTGKEYKNEEASND